MEEHEAVRVFDKVVEGDSREIGSVTLETKHGDLDFTTTAVSRETRMDYASTGLEGISTDDIDLDPDKVDEMSDSELMEEVLGSGVDLGTLTPDSERAEAAEEVVKESLEHEELGQTEIDRLVENEFGDDMLFELAEEIVTESKDVSGVSNFRLNKNRR
jgi:hypothetical protein